MSKYNIKLEDFKSGGADVYHGPHPNMGANRRRCKRREKSEQKKEFLKNGCKRQFPDCPKEPYIHSPICKVCNHYPRKYIKINPIKYIKKLKEK